MKADVKNEEHRKRRKEGNGMSTKKLSEEKEDKDEIDGHCFNGEEKAKLKYEEKGKERRKWNEKGQMK